MFSRERSEKQYIAEYYEYFIETEKYQYCLTLESPAKHFHDSATEGGKIHWSLCVAGAERIKEQQAQPSTAKQDSSQRQDSRTTIQQSKTREQNNYTAVGDNRAEQLYSSQRQDSRTTIQQSETRQQDNYTAVRDKTAEQLYSSQRQDSITTLQQSETRQHNNYTAVRDKRTGQQSKTREQDNSQRQENRTAVKDESRTTVEDKGAGQLYSSQRPRSRIIIITIKQCRTATSCIQDKSTNHINRCIVVFLCQYRRLRFMRTSQWNESHNRISGVTFDFKSIASLP